MASTMSLLGNDTIKIDTRILADFGPGEVAKLTYPTELSTVKTGKNGNTIFVQNASGFQTALELKVIRGSEDDKYLNSVVAAYKSEPTLFVLKNGELIKKIGDGAGNVRADTYLLVGGIPTKQVEAVVNVEGDTEQALSVYTFSFAGGDRSIA